MRALATEWAAAHCRKAAGRLLIASDLARNAANGAAKEGAQLAQRLVGALERMGLRVALMAGQRRAVEGERMTEELLAAAAAPPTPPDPPCGGPDQ